MNTSKSLIAASLALAGALCAGAAKARDVNDVQWTVTIGSTAPVGVMHAPVYRPVVPVQPVPVWHRNDVDGDGIPNWRDRYDNRRGAYGFDPRRDADRDGIPNSRDRYDNRRVGARWQPNDHDGDGIPNWRDRYDNRRDPRR